MKNSFGLKKLSKDDHHVILAIFGRHVEFYHGETGPDFVPGHYLAKAPVSHQEALGTRMSPRKTTVCSWDSIILNRFYGRTMAPVLNKLPPFEKLPIEPFMSSLADAITF